MDLTPRIGTTYMRRGNRLVVLAPSKNVKRYLGGALNSRTGKLIHVKAFRRNSELFIALVEAVRRAYTRPRGIHFVVDNFIIYKSRRTLNYLAQLAGRVVFHFLPPSSQGSTVTERLWKQMHDNAIRNHMNRRIDSLLEAVHEFFHGVQPFPGTKAP